MPTDLPTFRTKLLAERAAVLDEISVIDVPDEQARIAAAEATFRTASNQYEKAQRRWGLVSEKQERLVTLDAQIQLITP
jgi:ethanolamine utilization cobalamin adenosyltransferase